MMINDVLIPFPFHVFFVLSNGLTQLLHHGVHEARELVVVVQEVSVLQLVASWSVFSLNIDRFEIVMILVTRLNTMLSPCTKNF